MAIYPAHPVLIVDDDLLTVEIIKNTLASGGIEHIVQSRDSREVLPLLNRQPVECILLDIMMPHLSGKELLPQLKEKFPEIPVIMITGLNEVNTAVECMKQGANDYMMKPLEESLLLTGVRRLLELNEMRRKYDHLRQSFFSGKLNHPEAFEEVITGNPRMKSIMQYVEVIAPSPEPVLITGETGVGKEFIARIIHKLSKREGKIISVNAAGLDDNMFSDTLFGHEKGAFTDAVQNRSGMIRQAAGGTLFLDEIGDLSISSQVKLLRLLQEYEYYPLGADVPKETDTRVIAATNKDLKVAMEAGHFRKDLYHRLWVHPIHIPPLRERLDDIPLLVDHFLDEAAQKLGKKKPTVPLELYTLLKTYHFPGNIRELRAMVVNAVSSHSSMMLSLNSFKDAIGSTTGGPPWNREYNYALAANPHYRFTFPDQLPTLKQVEQLLIDEAMARSGGNQTIAARLLGISRQALNNRLQRKKHPDANDFY